jgi:alpha-tubulin suppressor-like RCC1 family protein
MYLIYNIVYTWGNILYKGTAIIKQQQPYLQPAQSITNISCGLNHIVSIDRYGDAFVLGSNECGQLGLEG